MKSVMKKHFRALSWRIDWADLELGNPRILDKIQRRADSFAETAADTAIIFGTHFRWDFLPYWPVLHILLSEISQALKEREIMLFDHHSATLVHRFHSPAEIRGGMSSKIHHLPWAPSPEAAADWKFNGEYLDSWRVIDARTGGPAYVPQYYAQEFCINHPGYRAAYAKYLKQLLAETGIDGLMCDDMIYFGGFYHCACEYCRKKLSFKLPETSDASFWGNWGDARWLEYLAMRRDSIGDFLETVKSALPERFPLMSCNTTGAYGGNSNHCGQSIHEFVRGDNLINLELCGENLVHPEDLQVALNYQAGASKKYGLPVIAVGYGAFSDSAGHLWAMDHLAGVSTWFSAIVGRSFPEEIQKHLPGETAIAKAFRFEKAHPELFDEPLEYDCAVYFSETTKYGSYFGSCEEGSTKDYRDLIGKLSSAGIRAETVFDFPADAAQSPCVVMPSTALLSHEEQAAMDKYLASGGVILRYGPDDLTGFPVCPDKDFESLEWLRKQTFDFYDPADEWRELERGLWYNPARNPKDLLTILRSNMRSDLPKVEASGFAVSVRKHSIHLLALEYDLKLNEELEAKWKQSSHARLIREAKPKNCASVISCSVPVKKVYCPLGGNARLEAGKANLEGNPMYIIMEI